MGTRTSAQTFDIPNSEVNDKYNEEDNFRNFDVPTIKDFAKLSRVEFLRIAKIVQYRFMVNHQDYYRVDYRGGRYSTSRQMLGYILKNHLEISQNLISYYMHRHHSTISHGIEVMTNYINTYPMYKIAYEDIIKQI